MSPSFSSSRFAVRQHSNAALVLFFLPCHSRMQGVEGLSQETRVPLCRLEARKRISTNKLVAPLQWARAPLQTHDHEGKVGHKEALLGHFLSESSTGIWFSRRLTQQGACFIQPCPRIRCCQSGDFWKGQACLADGREISYSLANIREELVQIGRRKDDPGQDGLLLLHQVHNL